MAHSSLQWRGRTQRCPAFVKLHCSGTPPKATRFRTGTKICANSAAGSGDRFCSSLQKGQKMLAGETTVSHASVRHSATELRGS
ncbi:hypothetical protein [Streptomyces sp. NPDC003688]